MLVELCARNYNTLDGLINGANGTFNDFTQTFSNHLYGHNFIIPKFETK
jgi:hypothetical protein